MDSTTEQNILGEFRFILHEQDLDNYPRGIPLAWLRVKQRDDVVPEQSLSSTHLHIFRVPLPTSPCFHQVPGGIENESGFSVKVGPLT